MIRRLLDIPPVLILACRLPTDSIELDDGRAIALVIGVGILLAGIVEVAVPFRKESSAAREQSQQPALDGVAKVPERTGPRRALKVKPSRSQTILAEEIDMLEHHRRRSALALRETCERLRTPRLMAARAARASGRARAARLSHVRWLATALLFVAAVHWFAVVSPLQAADSAAVRTETTPGKAVSASEQTNSSGAVPTTTAGSTRSQPIDVTNFDEDARVRQRVEHRIDTLLGYDAAADFDAVRVDVHDGDVMLAGSVSGINDRTRAKRIVGSMHGVGRVENELSVRRLNSN